jgi:hypothetical protein
MFIILLAGIIVIGFLNGHNDVTGKLVSNSSKKTLADDSCSAVICMKGSEEVYCPQDISSCDAKYDDCRVIECEKEQPASKAKPKSASKTSSAASSEEDVCTAEYNDCYDDGEAIVCKGGYEQCCAAFDNCRCGTTEDTTGEGQAKPDIDSEQAVACDTGVFVCSKQTITMSGDVAESKVTCKGSFQQCSTVYGSCECGTDTLTDFPTQYVGDAGTAEGGYDANNYWCEFKSRKVPCYMMPNETCAKKSNSCLRSDGIMVKCDGTFSYCNSRFDGNCLCGLEVKGYGFLNTEEQ